MERTIVQLTAQPEIALSFDQALAIYVSMLSIREAEERISDLVFAGEVKCPCHLYSGEEAIAVGVCSALDRDDMVFSNHRSHGHYLAKGGSLQAMFAEIFGKETGCSRGRGGSMHLIDPTVGMLGSAPIVAGTVSLATGAALASKIRKDGRVAVAFLGDGATGEGVLYESLNFAALKKLPIIFACENNLYATHMPVHEVRPAIPIFEVARPFGIRSIQVDGNDVLQVYGSIRQAVEECRQGQGPVFVEFLTYRFRGHVGPDDNIQGSHTDIRPEIEIEQWKQKDPLFRIEQYLCDTFAISKDYLEKARRAVVEAVEQAHAFAMASPYPKQQELESYVFKS